LYFAVFWKLELFFVEKGPWELAVAVRFGGMNERIFGVSSLWWSNIKLERFISTFAFLRMRYFMATN